MEEDDNISEEGRIEGASYYVWCADEVVRALRCSSLLLCELPHPVTHHVERPTSCGDLVIGTSGYVVVVAAKINKWQVLCVVLIG